MCADFTNRLLTYSMLGYYFGYNGQSRTWEMENWLYEQTLFKAMIVGTLSGSFAILTLLGLIS
jgi:hypothetical protein